MSKNYLTEAFKEMELLEESKSFSFNKQGAEGLDKFLEDDTLDDFEVVIDPEATNEDELQDSYIGKVILGCDVCHSMIYKSPEDIIIDEESQMANVGELCPYCFTGDGYKIIGKVAPYQEVTVETSGDKDVKVKVDGKVVDNDPETEEDRDDLEEEIQADQKYPVKSPISESVEEGKIEEESEEDSVNEEIESDQKYPVKSPIAEDVQPVEEALSNREKLLRAFPELNFDNPVTEEYKDQLGRVAWSKDMIDYFNQAANELGLENYNMDMFEKRTSNDGFENFVKITATKNGKKLNAEESRDLCNPTNVQEAKDMIQSWFLGDLDEALEADQKYPVKSPISESMEDISITTEDTVIKVKATPRADKETIEPVTEEEVTDMQAKADLASLEDEEIEEPLEDTSTSIEEKEVEMDEIDEESVDELGESYLKQVYENVNKFKTSNAILKKDKMIIEGIITFNSGKKAKTQFLFEAKEMTKKGKLKFLGENKNLSKNKKAFTLTGSVNGKKLMLESLNYNYSGIDSKTGKAKRLYGTVKVK